MRILAVPNWSFFDPQLCSEAVSVCSDVCIHYAQGDPDHERTVTAISGAAEDVFRGVTALCKVLLPHINLGLGGVHPFSGALDVAPFVIIEGSEAELIRRTREWARELWGHFEIPVHLYEKAAFQGNEYRLPVLRGQLGPVVKAFDYGEDSHPSWGYSVVGVRSFLLAVNLNFSMDVLESVRRLAKDVRTNREAGDPRFAGVRSLAFRLEQQNLAQLSLNMTVPDCTCFDDVCTWVTDQTDADFDTELIGVIRDVDLPKSTMLSPRLSQIVPTL